MSVGARIAAGFLAGLVLIAAIGLSAYVSTQRLIEQNRSVAHTYEVVKDLEHALSALKDAETGQRGFILTGEDRYLEPYDAAAGEIQHDIDALIELTRDNPVQQESLQQIEKLSAAKLAELRETIELRKKSGLDPALAIVRSDRGKQIMDQLRVVVAEMEQRERRLLDQRKEAAAASANRSIQTVSLWMPLGLLLLAIVAVVLMRTVRFGGSPAMPIASRKKWSGIAVRYASAVVIVAVATVLRMRLADAFGSSAPVPYVFPRRPLGGSHWRRRSGNRGHTPLVAGGRLLVLSTVWPVQH